MEDSEIIALFFARDETAVKESVAKYERYCHAVAYRILGDAADAEECVNDTWLRAWNSIPPAAPDDLRAYLAKITRHLSLDRLEAENAGKRVSRHTLVPLDELAELLPADDPDPDPAVGALTAHIDTFLRTLPDRTADIFVLRYFHFTPVWEIAGQLGISENLTAAILSRTRKKLKKYLIGKGYSL